MDNTQTILDGHTDAEKCAYLTAIASIATADRQASEEELQSLTTLCESASLPDEQVQQVLQSAQSADNSDLTSSLDILKKSDLKYALITDLIAFAKLDSDYTQSEQQSVQDISAYLGVNQNQFSLLGQFTDATTGTQVTPEEVKKPGFLSALGIEDKMKSAGINSGGLLKGLLTIAAPMLITKLITGGLGRRGTTTGGGMFGGNSGGLGGMFGNRSSGGGLGGMLGGGGIGSIISMLNGGRGFGSAGGLLGSLFGGNRR